MMRFIHDKHVPAGGQRLGHAPFVAGEETDAGEHQLIVEEGIGLGVRSLDGVTALVDKSLVTMTAAYPEGSIVHGSYFIVRGVPTPTLVVTEGPLLPVAIADLPGLLHRLTPSACFAARLFLMGQDHAHKPAL